MKEIKQALDTITQGMQSQVPVEILNAFGNSKRFWKFYCRFANKKFWHKVRSRNDVFFYRSDK